jgi:outer membrane protein assembly factor BamD
MKNTILILALIASLASCDNLEKIQKSKDYNFKLKKANEYYDQKKWHNANTLYNEVLTVYKGTNEMENIYYKYANSFFFLKDYLTASYHYKNFCEIFPSSPKKEECEFLKCLCLFKQSSRAGLDQSNTIQAIASLQTFLTLYPESNRADEANTIIDDARAKLEAHEESSAYLYYKIGEYKSAVTAFTNLLKKFPDSKKSDYYQYMVLSANYYYSRNSVADKLKERYDQCLVDYNDLITNYPNSKYKNEADKVKNLIFAALEKLKKS